MARGVLSGMIMGGVVSVAGAAGLSIAVGPPDVPRPDVAALEVPAGSEFDTKREDRQASLPAPLPQTEPGQAPRVAAPAPDDLEPMEGAATDPAAQPQTGQAEDALGAPPSGGETDMASVQSEAPVLPNPQAVLPVVPEAEEGLSISTEPAQPALSQTEEEQSAFPSGAESAPETEAAPEPEAEPASEPAPEVAAEPAPEIASQEPAPEQEPAPDQEQAAVQRPAIGTPSVPLTERKDEAVSSRLPSVGAAQQEAQPAEPAAPVAAAEGQKPIDAFAAPFENPENKPLMAIVLMDQGGFSSAVEALSSFPYPISFAIDPAQEGATEAMARYRAAGFEVLALADIPSGAAPSDVEVSLAGVLAKLPQAVAVMEGDKTGLQASRAISDQVTAALAASGHGVVMFPKGLDTARKLARKEGVPAASVFRDFDSAGQSASVIRRFLDQAAFKAGQEAGGVVMVGRVRPETVSALILWGLADRASRVALAPVSAVLKAQP